MLTLVLVFGSLYPASAQMTMPPPNLCRDTVITSDRALHNGEVFDCLRIESGAVTLDEGATIRLTTLDQVGGSFACGLTGALVIRDVPPTDADQFTTGLVIQGGKFTCKGRPSLSLARLTTEVAVGDTQLKLDRVPTGVLVGQRVVLPDSRQQNPALPDVLAKNRYVTFPDGTSITYGGHVIETFTITAITGQVLTLDHPASTIHPGGRNAAGVIEFYPAVAFIDTGFTIRSENPQGTRGHVMFTMQAAIDVEQVMFQDLGRTTIEHLGPKNLKGRYAAHFHFLQTPPTFIGNRILNTGPFKWGVTIHASNNGTYTDNVLLGAAGSGFMTELMTEKGNLIARNFVIGTSGNPTRGDLYSGLGEFGFNATAYWLGPSNRVIDNLSANSVWDEFGMWGDNHQVGLEFKGNEAFGCQYGMEPWYFGGPDGDTIVDHFTAWNCKQAVFGYPSSRVTYRKLTYRGNPATAKIQYQSAGISVGDYQQYRLRLEDPDIQNAYGAIYLPYGDAGPIPGIDPAGLDVVITGGTLAGNMQGIYQRTPVGALNAEQIKPHIATITGLHNSVLPGGYELVKQFQATSGANLTQLQRVILVDYQGTAGRTFEVFSPEQKPDFVIPNVGFSNGQTGKTNAQAWADASVAIAGAVAPCSNSPREVWGFACALGQTPVPDPIPVPVPVPVPVAQMLEWDHDAADLEAMSDSYAARVDGMLTTLPGVVCAAVCRAPLPMLSVGTHTLTLLRSYFVNNGWLPSVDSNAVTVTIGAPPPPPPIPRPAPRNLRVVP